MRGGKTIDILLVLCLGYAIYTFGRFIGDHDGYQLGYMHGYSSFWKDAYDHLRDSLVTLENDNIQ